MNQLLLRFLIVITVLSCNTLAVTLGRDFIVNRNNQYDMNLPIVKSDVKGNTYLFWCARENINGTLTNNILYRKFDMNGIALGAPVLVEGLYTLPTAMQVTMADSGNFAVCWVKKGDVWGALYMKRYSKTGVAVDYSPVMVTDSVDLNTFDCAINDIGDCAIVAKKNIGSSTWRLTGQILPAGGTSLALPVGQLWDSYPSIAINDSRRLVYMIGTESDGLWYRTGSFSATALTWADPGAYITTDYFKDKQSAKVALFGNGEFIVLWQQLSATGMESTLNGRRYSQNGSPSGSIFVVASAFPNNNTPTGLSISPTGQFVASWSPVLNDCSMRAYSRSGAAVTNPISLFTSALAEGVSTGALQFSTTIDTLGEATAASNPGGEVYFQRYTATGGINGFEMKANVGSGCTNPAVTVDRSLRTSAVVYENSPDGRVLLQVLKSKQIYNKPAAITVNATGSTGTSPAVSLANNTMAVVWQDLRDGETAPVIYLQLFDTAGSSFSAVGGNRQISDVGAYSYFPSVASGTGKHLVVWQSSPTINTASGIYGQFMNSTGSASGVQFTVSASTTNSIRPVAVSNGRNDFAVVWQQTTTATKISTIFARRYTIAGTAVGDTIRINETGSATSPSAAMDTAGNLGIAWINGGDEVHCRVITPGRSDKVAEFRVDTGSAIKSTPGLAMNSKGAFIVTWKTTVAKETAVASRLYNANGTQQTGVRHNSDVPHRNAQALPAVAAGDSISLRVWVNSFCLDTTKTDICGEFAALNDYSATAVRMPDMPPRVTLEINRSHGAQYFDCRGRLLGTTSGKSRTRGIVIVRQTDGSVRRVMGIGDYYSGD